MKKRKLTKILQNWLQENEGWFNKAYLLTLTWKYDGESRTYSADTVGRKLREATEEGLILSRTNNKGQTEYSGKEVKKTEYVFDPIRRVMVRV